MERTGRFLFEIEVEAAGRVAVLGDVRCQEDDRLARHTEVEHDGRVVVHQDVRSRVEVVDFRVLGHVDDELVRRRLPLAGDVVVSAQEQYVIVAELLLGLLEVEVGDHLVLPRGVFGVIAPGRRVEDRCLAFRDAEPASDGGPVLFHPLAGEAVVAGIAFGDNPLP